MYAQTPRSQPDRFVKTGFETPDPSKDSGPNHPSVYNQTPGSSTTPGLIGLTRTAQQVVVGEVFTTSPETGRKTSWTSWACLRHLWSPTGHPPCKPANDLEAGQPRDGPGVR